MNLFLNLLLLLFLHFSRGIDEQACFFPESEVHPFFFDVFSDVVTDTVIVESVVEPPDSHLVLASVRSGNIPEANFTNRFSLETTNSGRFMLKTISPLVLPIYPSEVEETYLYVTVVCNHHAYPLITIRVKAANLLAPQFYNEPYVLEVDESLPIGSYLDTPIIAVDWDPSPSYNITFQLQDTEVPFEVVIENTKRVSQLSFGKSLNWTTAQLPTLVRLRVLKKIEKLPITLNLIAKDAGQPQQFTTTTINIISKHTKERPDFKTHPTKVSLPIQAPFVNINDEMVSTQNSSSNNIGPSSEDGLPRFKDCNILVTLPENTERGTYVTTLKILNRKKWTMIDMVDPDGTFDIKQDSGDVIVRDNRLLDREMFTSIELVAEIHGSNHRTECFRVRVNVELLDENDNKPAFEKEKYWFHVSDELLIGSQIGKLRAQDIDEADGGRVTYHIVNSSEYIPFTIETQGKDGILLSTGDLSRRDVYQLEVVARDHGNPSRSSQVPVDIYVLKSATKQQAKKTEPLKKALIKGVASVTASSLNLNAIEDNDSKELITTRTEPVTVISVNDASTIAEDKEATLTSSKIITVITPATITQESTSEKDTQEPHKSITFTFGSHPTLTNIRLINKETVPSKPTRSTLIESMEEYFEDDDREQEQKSEENTDEKLFAFKDPTYYYEVFGEPIEGDIIGRVIAEPEAQMYGLERTMAGIFKLDPDIGELAVGKKLYNQKEGNLTFEVSATNGISTAKTVVTVFYDPTRNKSDAIPHFDQPIYKFRIQENEPPKVIGIVRAFHVALSSDNVLLNYEIITDDEDFPFDVHERSGEITSQRSLDYEKQANYNFKVQACLSINPSFCGFASVIVAVEDVNDNTPKFPSSVFHITLPSDLQIGSAVIKLRAVDGDSGNNGVVSYAINPPSSTFAIDYDTGAVVTISSLMEPRYSILVNAFDHGVPKRTDITELRIIVHGTNPSAPVFDQKRYEVTLSSPVRAGSVVAELHAKDPDPGLEGQVSYRFAETNDQKTQTDISKFLINDQTGVVSVLDTMTSLDGPFDLVVEAEDESTVFKRKTSVVLHVNIVGDSSLRFFPLPTTIYISTEKAVGSVVLRASAFTTSSSTVHFRVLEDSSQFVMDGDLLRVATHLIPGYTHLTVRAETDSTHVDHQLRVIVMDGRDKYPIFPQLTYDIDIPIESRFPLTVHRFDARLINGTLRYQFFPEGDTPVGVHLDEISGDLTITSDYLRMSANHDTQFIVVRANNIEYPKFYSDVGVALSIVSNKASMRFPQSLYRIETMENIPIGSIFGPTIEVFPKVSDSLVRYSIVPDSIIGIHSNGSLFVKEDIDLEQLPVDTSGNLNFVVTADTGVDRVSTKLQIKIKDANEFPPKFDSKEYLATIVENSIPGSKIVRVRASDGDLTEGEHLLYKITGGSGRNLVFIQEDGTIILGEKPLDYETMSNFNVEVEAIDRTGNTDRTMVRISVQDVNDNAPVFINQTMTWTVPEGSTSESLLIAAEDLDAGDNGIIQFYIVEGNTDGYFEIVPEGHNTASLKLTQPLDREEHPTHNLTVEARDQGTPQQFATTTIIVNISDVNDNGPIFKQLEYKQKAPSNLPIGFPILTIAAFDADGDRIAYSLKGPGCQTLAIDPLGVISFVVSTSQRSLGVIKCVIEASDGSHSSKATVIIDVFSSIQPTITSAPNHAPEFSKEIYSINVTLDKTDRLLKKVEAKDPDGDIIFYSIEPPEYRNLFEVDTEGIVSLRVPVSYLTQALYSFLVVAEDRKTPIMSTFTNIKVHIPENKRFILTSTSIDPLPTKISIMEVVGSSSESGPSTVPTISIANSRTESLPERINLERSSSDGILSRLGTRIDADEGNSNNSSSLIITSTQGTFDMMQSSELSTSTPTLFRRLKYMYSIRVDAPVGSYLGQVELLNIEGAELSFENSTRFSIDEHGRVRTNVLFTKVGKIEDVIVAKQQDKVLAKVPFVVHIIGGMTSTSTMSTVPPSITTTLNAPLTENNVITTVNSTGFSFLRPVYFAFMPEGNYTNGVKVAIKPEPLSTNSQGRIMYSIAGKEQNMPFYLTDDGQLIVFSVDREKTSNYMLNVTATAMDMPLGTAYALINVTVLDVNDNYPIFENHPLVLGILRNSPPGKPLYQFSATDADADNYGQVAYEVEGTGGNFVIEPNDGTLSVSQILDDVPDEVMITVIARDNGRPALKAEQQVSIRLFDPLFNAPRLPKEVPEQVVRPHAIPNTEIAQFLAGPNINTQPGLEKILYGLANNYSGLFEIEDDGRLILARRPMENEENRYHQLNVTAENSHGKDWIIINIFVEGTPLTTTPKSSRNNMRCLFPTRIYNAEVMENLEKRIKLIKVTSNCESEGRAYIYTLATESDDFELDSKTGELFAIHSLDREKRSLHFIYINVTSNIVPDTSTRVLRQSNPVIEHAKAKLVASQTLVIVRVLDENDNCPSFIHTTQDGELTATVEWQAPLLTPILRMQAKDADERAQLTFSIKGEDSDLFIVNSTTGLLLLRKNIIEEKRKKFEFTAIVSDGIFTSEIHVTIHKLSPDANIIQLTSEMPHSDVHEYMVERTLNEIFESESKVLVKQPFVDHEGHADPTRTHLFVYALDRKTKEPYSGNELVEILKAHSEELRTSPPRISSVALLSSQSTSLSGTDLLLTIICIVLLILLVITCCFLSRYYKRKRSISTTEREYMVNTIRAGPRPYDVEVVSRQTAQAVLAARPIPEPMHSQIEVAVSPIFMDGTISTNRSDTTRDFANSVRERPSLLQSALARHRVHVSTPLSISSVVEHDKI